MRNSFKKLFSSVLTSQTSKSSDVSPWIILFQLVALSIFRPQMQPFILVCFALFFTLNTKRSYFWSFGIIIQPSLKYFAIPNMIIGLISCTQRWKLKIYIYLVVYFLTYQIKSIHIMYNIIILTGLSIQTYQRLSFPKIQDNRIFFIGFNCLILHNFFCLFHDLLFLFEKTDFTFIEVLPVLLVIYSSFRIISTRIKKLVFTNLDQLLDYNSILHLIVALKQRSLDIMIHNGIQSQHRQNCLDVYCFCRKESSLGFQKQYIRALLTLTLKKLTYSQFKDQVEYYFIEQLLQQDLFTLAVQAFVKQNDYKWDIFKEIKSQGLKKMLKDRLKYTESSYKWKNNFEDAFAYQNNINVLKKKIIELTQIKTLFWNQILKSKIKAKNLKKLGALFQKKLNNMNTFYQLQIATIEKQTRIFSGGILYNLFLAVVTNYKSKVQENIKNLFNKQEQKIQNLFKLAIMKISITKNRMGTIQNLNNNCIKMIDRNHKNQCLGNNISQLIPSCYLQEHCAGMMKLKQFNNKGKIGQEIQSIFILTKNKYIVSCSMFLKFSPDIFNQLSIIGIFKHYKNGREFMLLNNEGIPEFVSNHSLNPEIIKTKEMQSAINYFYNSWKNVNEQNPQYPLVDQIKIQTKFEGQDYCCNLSSPLSLSFKFPKRPPIHIVISVDSKTYVHQEQQDEQNHFGGLKKIKQILCDQMISSQTASYCSNKSSIIETLKISQTGRNLGLFLIFYLTISGIFVSIFILFTIHFLATDIAWLHPNSGSNTLKLLVIHYNTQYQIASFVNKQLTLYGLESGAITNQWYSAQIGKPNYQVEITNEVSLICERLQKLVRRKYEQDGQINSKYFSILQQEYQAYSRSNLRFITKFNNLLNYGLSNCQVFSKGLLFDGLKVQQLYWDLIYPYYFQIYNYLKGFIQQQFKVCSFINQTLFSICIVFIALSMTAIYVGTKYIRTLQNQIYDIMTSITPNFIYQEVQKISQLTSNLRNNSNSFNTENRQNYINFNEQKQEIQNSIYAISQQQKKNRIGQLDLEGANGKRFFLMIIIFCFISFPSGMFILRRNFVSEVNLQFNSISEQCAWRNERLDLIVNIKKYMFNFHVNDLIQNKPLSRWIIDTIKFRKSSYLFKDNAENFEINCSISSIFCQNKTMSELQVNVLYNLMYSQTATQNTSKYIGIMDVLIQTTKSLNNKHIQAGIEKIQKLELQITKRTMKIYIIFVLAIIISICLSINYIRRLKKVYLQECLFIALLNESMISQNKRVQSYLRKISKKS